MEIVSLGKEGKLEGTNETKRKHTRVKKRTVCTGGE